MRYTESSTDDVSSYYCALCDKRYAKYTTYDNHVNSYDHAHRQRLKDLERREVRRQFARWRRPSDAQKQQAKELQRVIEFANGRQQVSVAVQESIRLPASYDSSTNSLPANDPLAVEQTHVVAKLLGCSTIVEGDDHHSHGCLSTADMKPSSVTVTTSRGQTCRRRRRLIDQSSSATVSRHRLGSHGASAAAASDSVAESGTFHRKPVSNGEMTLGKPHVDMVDRPSTFLCDSLATDDRRSRDDLTEITCRADDNVCDNWYSTPAKRRKTVSYKSAAGIIYHKNNQNSASEVSSDSGAVWQDGSGEGHSMSLSSSVAKELSDGRPSARDVIKQLKNVVVGDDVSGSKPSLANCGEEEMTVHVKSTIDCHTNECELAADSAVRSDKEADRRPTTLVTFPQEEQKICDKLALRHVTAPAMNSHENRSVLGSKICLDDRNLYDLSVGVIDYQSINDEDSAPTVSRTAKLSPVCDDNVAMSTQIVCFHRQHAQLNDRSERLISATTNGRKRKVVLNYAARAAANKSFVWTVERPVFIFKSPLSLVQLHLDASRQQIQDNKSTSDTVDLAMSIGRQSKSTLIRRLSAANPVAVKKLASLSSVASTGAKQPVVGDQSPSNACLQRRLTVGGGSISSDCHITSGHVVRSLPVASPPRHIKSNVLGRSCLVAIDRRPLLVMNRHCAVGEQLRAASGAVPLDPTLRGAATTPSCIQWLQQQPSVNVGVQSPYPAVFMYPPKSFGIPFTNRFGVTSVQFPGTFSSTVAAHRAIYGMGFERLATCLVELARPVCHIETPPCFVQHIL